MSTATYNFCAGPAQLPDEVLAAVREDLNREQHARTILELSHRTPVYAELQEKVIANLHELLGVGSDRTILLLQGGASGQFAMLPYNFLREGAAADYVVRGYWGEKAAQQAGRVGRVRRLQAPTDWNPAAIYGHITTNETISGTRQPEDFEQPAIPLCADMSSDILAAPRDYNRYALAYAGAQKNLGCAGLAIVVAEKEFLSHARRNLPAAFCYLEHAKAGGVYHTPNTFAVNTLYHMTEWLKQETLPVIWERNTQKATLLYAELDRSPFWRPLAPRAERSLTNVTFRLPTAALEADFLAGAEAAGLFALKGHRAAGGIRASLYNAMPLAGVEALVAYMQDFESRHA